jgi:four helix bundle suffix protein
MGLRGQVDELEVQVEARGLHANPGMQRHTQNSALIPPHGGYRNLKTFQLAQLVYDLTVRFCDRYIDRRSRTHDQMVQAARSGVQNIAEGSQASATSKKFELKLTNVARASLEELRLDYQDFLRQKRLREWDFGDPRRRMLVEERCTTVDAVEVWVSHGARMENGPHGPRGRDGQRISLPSMGSMQSIESIHSETSANAILVLIGVACSLLNRQVNSLARAFEDHGGFTERLYKLRRGGRY